MTYPYWRRKLSSRTVALSFDAERALRIASPGADALRVDELAHRLSFDADYLFGAAREARS